MKERYKEQKKERERKKEAKLHYIFLLYFLFRFTLFPTDEILAIMASSRNFKESIKTERDRDIESKCSSIEVDERTEYSKEQKERDHDYDANNNNSNKNNKNNNSNRNLSSQSESKDDCDHRLGNIINNMHNEKLDTKVSDRYYSIFLFLFLSFIF